MHAFIKQLALLTASALMSLVIPLAVAHNVVSGVYADGMVIEGEIGYSNGEMAEAGTVVKVYDENGDLLSELVLNESGAFVYEATTATKHTFKANLSLGHVAEMVVEANEINPPMGYVAPADSVAKTTDSKKVVDGVVSITVEQIDSIVRSAVAQQIRPLQKELRAYKEKVMFRDITGGLGFIFGLFGVAAWMASRRNKGDKNATVS